MLTHMRTTIELSDSLFERAKAAAARRGTTLRALVEEGLIRTLEDSTESDETVPPRRAVFAGKTGLAAPHQEWQLPELLRRERSAGRDLGAAESDDR